MLQELAQMKSVADENEYSGESGPKSSTPGKISSCGTFSAKTRKLRNPARLEVAWKVVPLQRVEIINVTGEDFLPGLTPMPATKPSAPISQPIPKYKYL